MSFSQHNKLRSTEHVLRNWILENIVTIGKYITNVVEIGL